MNHEMREEEILTRYKQLWGTAITAFPYSHTIDKAPNPLTIVEFAVPEEGVWVYATIGASHRAMTYPHADHDLRMELFIFANQVQRELVESVGALALYPFALDTYLDEGHTIRGEGEGIIPGSPLTDILITRPVFGKEGADYIHHSDDTHTLLFWVVPIYAAERLFATQQGWELLLAVFEEHETDVYDLWRVSAI